MSTKEPLDGVLHLRLSTHEKVLWVEAAGGSRRLSQWVRERCNAAVTERGTQPNGHSLKPDVVLEGDVPSESVEASPGGSSSVPRSVTAANCPAAAMSHKPGTECPSCKTVFPPVVVAAAPVVRERVVRPDPKPNWR